MKPLCVCVVLCNIDVRENDFTFTTAILSSLLTGVTEVVIMVVDGESSACGGERGVGLCWGAVSTVGWLV